MPPPTPAVGRVAQFFREARVGNSLPFVVMLALPSTRHPISYWFPAGPGTTTGVNVFVKATPVLKHVPPMIVKSRPKVKHTSHSLLHRPLNDGRRAEPYPD